MFSILPPYRRHISNLLLYPHLLLQSANLKAADLRVSFLSPCLQLRKDYDNFILKCFDEPFFIHELPTQGNGFFFLVNPCFCASSHASFRYCFFYYKIETIHFSIYQFRMEYLISVCFFYTLLDILSEICYIKRYIVTVTTYRCFSVEQGGKHGQILV